MSCPVPEEAMKSVVSYLRRSGQAVVFSEGSYVLEKGTPNLNMIRQAWNDGAVLLTDSGSIQVCGTRVFSELDTVMIRRRVEDHLRKNASKQDIVRIAACLGVKLM